MGNLGALLNGLQPMLTHCGTSCEGYRLRAGGLERGSEQRQTDQSKQHAVSFGAQAFVWSSADTGRSSAWLWRTVRWRGVT